MNHNVFFNGEILPANQAAISISDVGFLHGGSAFSTVLARHGRAFRLDRHIARLFETCDLLSIRRAVDAPSLTQAVHDLLTANALDASRLRITLTPGDIHAGQPTTLITAEPLPTYPPDWYTRGVPVAVAGFRQSLGDPTYGHKTGCYFPRILARQEAHRKGAQEALWYTPDNRLAEGCFANVFLVRDGVVCTPPRDTPVLPGITRGCVLELCGRLGIPADDQGDLTVNDMLSAGEIFLTSCLSGLVPVSMVERHGVGSEKPGPVTERLMAAYNELVETETQS